MPKTDENILISDSKNLRDMLKLFLNNQNIWTEAIHFITRKKMSNKCKSDENIPILIVALDAKLLRLHEENDELWINFVGLITTMGYYQIYNEERFITIYRTKD